MLIICTEPALSADRGWLNFVDGNAVSGELVETTDDGGVFRSDRFGEIAFSRNEAQFVADSARDEGAEGTTARAGLAADSWGLSGSISSKKEDDEDEEGFEIDLLANWDRSRDDTRLQLRSEYKVKNGTIDTNEQSARVRWNHAVARRWFTMSQLYVERDTVDIAAHENLDYLLLQVGVGAGIEQTWTGRAVSRFGLGYNRFSVELRDFNVTGYVNAPTLFIENDAPISERISLTNWINIYDWKNGNAGYEAETELDFAITDQYSIGIRHRYRDNGATLRSESLSEIKLYTRILF